MPIYLSEYIYSDVVRIIRQHTDITDNFNRIEDTNGIILRAVNVNRRITSQAGKLKMIGKYGMGCSTVDLGVAREVSITMVSTSLANTSSVVELIVGLILGINRNIVTCDTEIRGEGFVCTALSEMTGIELTRKTVGLVGMGNIIWRMGEILRNGFSVRLMSHDPYCSGEQTAFWEIRRYGDLSSMLRAPDFVNINVSLTPSTTNMMSEEDFDHFRKDAVLINTVRGGVVNEDDLYHALKGKESRAVAYDAFVEEPPEGTNKLVTLDDFCATLHTGTSAGEALYRVGMEVVEEILNVIDGRNVKNRVIQAKKNVEEGDMSRTECVIAKDFKHPERALVERFTGVAVTNLDDCMNRMSAIHEDTGPVSKSSLPGTAFTVRVPEGGNLMFRVAMDPAKPGGVVVADVGGDTRRSVFGELMVTYCRRRGVNGIVVDGSIRDVGAMKVLDDFVVYVRGVTPDGLYKNGPGGASTPIICSRRTVYPGGIALGDEDGIVFIRPKEAEELLKRVDAFHVNELKILDTIEKEGTYTRPWVDKEIGPLGVGYMGYMEYMQYVEYAGL